MGKIISSYIFPHPPVIVPEIGEGREEEAAGTIAAAKKAAEEISNESPTTIIITTPHGPVFQDYIYISTSQKLHGDFGTFGRNDVGLEFENNVELADKIISLANRDGIFCGGLDDSIAKKYKVSKNLDHGVLVPLYFVRQKYGSFKIVHISIAGLPFQDLYKFGMSIAKAVEETEERVVLLASGDLSHKLSGDAPYGFDKRGKEFDRLLVDSLKSSDVERLLELDEEFCESAGECGLRSFLMMFGALDGYEISPEVYSYEGPFGVGYAIARIGVGERNPGRQILKRAVEKDKARLTEIRDAEDSYVGLARKTLETYVRKGEIIGVPGGLPGEILANRAGVFVSIKKSGQLRGCIGTIAPTRRNIAEEIIRNAISSGTEDPRFEPVEEDELDKLVYSVDVLKEPQPIKSMDELDVIRYGVIVRSGSRSGLLLPNLEGVDTPEKQVSIALQKAGIRHGEKYNMEKFEVIRHK